MTLLLHLRDHQSFVDTWNCFRVTAELSVSLWSLKNITLMSLRLSSWINKGWSLCQKLITASTSWQKRSLWLDMTSCHWWEKCLTPVSQIIGQQVIYNGLNMGKVQIWLAHWSIRNHFIQDEVFLKSICFKRSSNVDSVHLEVPSLIKVTSNDFGLFRLSRIFSWIF